MPPKSRTLGNIATAAIFILLEIAAIGMLRRSSSLQDIWINRASHRVIAFCWGWTEGLSNYFHLRETNDALALRNHRLEEELRLYRSLVEEAGMRELNEARPHAGRFTYVPARIRKISRNTQHNYIILDRGSEDGIVPNSGIITSKGVVGIISAVSRHYSYGLTLMNSNISVSARIGRDGAIAPLRWDGIRSDRARLEELPLHYEVAPGDTVWTSGFSAIFPADVPIGITDYFKAVDGVSGEVGVQLFEDFNSLRYVTVVMVPGREEIEALQK